MDDFLNALVGLIPNPLKGAARAIVDRLLTLWHSVTDFWGRVRGGWQRLRNASYGLGLSQLRHLYALAVTMRWFVTVYVPRQASLFADAARSEARYLIGQAADFARAELRDARTFLAALIYDTQQLLGDWARWTLNNVNDLLARAHRIEDRLFGTLGSPERLAAWAIGAIIDAGIGWFEDNAVRIGRRLVAQRTQIFIDGLGKAEDIVSRIL